MVAVFFAATFLDCVFPLATFLVAAFRPAVFFFDGLAVTFLVAAFFAVAVSRGDFLGVVFFLARLRPPVDP
ncbi:MAG: hypothetical protein AB8G96_07415 [Phycisphaerales bacterium]